MKIPLYLLGLLKRYGPMHGYQLKKVIEDNISDFTLIKLPNIYYHLEKMEKEGLLSSSEEKGFNAGSEKTVYSVSGKGEKRFEELLRDFLDFGYRSSFDSDAVFFFSDSIPPESICRSLEDYRFKMQKALSIIKKHRDESMKFIPEENRAAAVIIFSHHEKHYKAELDWTEETIELYKRVK
ncbi:MAG: helix-turn-helix transcriptional regulator [Brevinematales bacterium]|jgi:DNA-binding PadR family transcriptional regulator